MGKFDYAVRLSRATEFLKKAVWLMNSNAEITDGVTKSHELTARINAFLAEDFADEFRTFIDMVASVHWDGETLPDGSEFDRSNDDTHFMLRSFITKARQIQARSAK